MNSVKTGWQDEAPLTELYIQIQMLVYTGLSNSIRVSYDIAKAIVKSICVNEIYVSHTS